MANTMQPIEREEDSCEVPTQVSNLQEAKIRRVANGFIITVGCKTFVSKNWDEVATGLGEYWENPAAAEKKFCK